MWIKDYIIILSRLYPIGFFGLITYTFYRAYFTTSKKVYISINECGEADIEFIMLIVIWVIVLLGLYYERKQM